MSERDELAGLFESISFPETPEERDTAEQAIRDMLSPRTITTAAELDGLAVGSVIALGPDREQVNVALKTHADKWGLAGQSRPLDSPTLFRAADERDGYTLTVLSEPAA